MGLRQIAAADLKIIVEDNINGFGFPVTVTDPAGQVESLIGFTNDIAQLIDPDTGQAVSGRMASVALIISSLTALGLGIPEAISDSSSKPWIIKFDDINGNPFTFRVSQSNPDRNLGIVTCILESYDDS